jgi:glutamyl-tRNA reductase
MLGVIGINYESAPLEVREHFSFNELQLVEFGSHLKQNEFFLGIIGLSTCNRSEFYFQMEDCSVGTAFNFMFNNLKTYFKININIHQYFYFKSGLDAFRHLFYVVSGADSMVIGESLIVNQVHLHSKTLLKKVAVISLSLTELIPQHMTWQKNITCELYHLNH